MNPIFPSILTTDYLGLKHKLLEFEEVGIDYIHLDVMDGHFVKNIAFGPMAVNNIHAYNNSFFQVDSHLMVDNPSRVIPWFVSAGSEWISFHIETGDNIKKNLIYLRDKGIKGGLAINPDTDIKEVFKYIEYCHYILIMSVFPGYGGQSFIEETFNRIESLKKEIIKQNKETLIQVDGGINLNNAKKVIESGADLLVMGTAFYGSNKKMDITREIAHLFKGRV